MIRCLMCFILGFMIAALSPIIDKWRKYNDR